MMMYSILEFLFIVTNVVAILIGVITNVIFLIKSIHAKKMKITVDADTFLNHTSLVGIIKSCGMCGFGFQLLAWLMFSAQQIGFIELYKLTFFFALAWAGLCLLTVLISALGNFINVNSSISVFKKKMQTFSMFSIIYFIVTFLIY